MTEEEYSNKDEKMEQEANPYEFNNFFNVKNLIEKNLMKWWNSTIKKFFYFFFWNFLVFLEFIYNTFNYIKNIFLYKNSKKKWEKNVSYRISI